MRPPLSLLWPTTGETQLHDPSHELGTGRWGQQPTRSTSHSAENLGLCVHASLHLLPTIWAHQSKPTSRESRDAGDVRTRRVRRGRPRTPKLLTQSITCEAEPTGHWPSENHWEVKINRKYPTHQITQKTILTTIQRPRRQEVEGASRTRRSGWEWAGSARRVAAPAQKSRPMGRVDRTRTIVGSVEPAPTDPMGQQSRPTSEA